MVPKRKTAAPVQDVDRENTAEDDIPTERGIVFLCFLIVLGKHA